MKIALLGDVHGNLPALEAVLQHARQQKVAAIWNIGDWVGYNAFPNEVVATLRQAGAVSIVGNYDLKVLRFKKKRKKWRRSKHPQKFRSFEWTYHTLTPENRRYLKALPHEMVLRLGKTSVLLTHGSPASNTEPLTDDTPTARLRTLAKLAGVDVVVCGHSHQPMVRQVEDVWFINSGTVGLPHNGDPRAVYATLKLKPKKKRLKVEHHYLTYDVEQAMTAIEQQKLPADFGRMLRYGRSLNWIEQNL